LQAPARLARLLDSRAARWLFTPSLSAGRFAMRIANSAARFVIRELERFAGGNVLSTISDFFEAASEAVDAMVDRLHKTETLLHSPEVRFILVTTAEEDRLRRARELIVEMEAERLKLSAIVINRFLDEETWAEVMKHSGTEPPRLKSIARLRASSNGAAGNGVVEFLEEYRTRALDDIARVEGFIREMASKVTVAMAPEIEVGVRDLAALSRVARCLLTPLSLKRSRQNHRDPTP